MITTYEKVRKLGYLLLLREKEKKNKKIWSKGGWYDSVGATRFIWQAHHGNHGKNI